MIVPPYRIVYEVRPTKVIVLRVWHARRDLEQLAGARQLLEQRLTLLEARAAALLRGQSR